MTYLLAVAFYSLAAIQVYFWSLGGANHEVALSGAVLAFGMGIVFSKT